jgi:CDP-diacylglycerol--glycerol-3-phosphate 3-phosphatidyltransferase
MWFSLAAAVPVWTVVLGTVVWLRAQHPGARVGVATMLTLGRGLLLGALAGCVPLARAGRAVWLPGLLYTTAAVADLADGYVARRRGEVSELGGRLDVAMDALGLVVGPLAALALGRLPVWYLLLGASYYFFQAGLWLRGRRGLPVHRERVRPQPYARMFAGYQMGLVATVLFPVVGPPGTSIAATAFMLPTLALFAHEWLLVTGRAAPDSQRVWRAVATGRMVLAHALPAARTLAALGILALVLRHQLAPAWLAAGALLAGGVLTRLCAFAAAVMLAVVLRDDFSLLPTATFAVTLLPLLAGGGRAALWSPEDRWLFARAGAPRRSPA